MRKFIMTNQSFHLDGEMNSTGLHQQIINEHSKQLILHVEVQSGAPALQPYEIVEITVNDIFTRIATEAQYLTVGVRVYPVGDSFFTDYHFESIGAYKVLSGPLDRPYSIYFEMMHFREVENQGLTPKTNASSIGLSATTYERDFNNMANSLNQSFRPGEKVILMRDLLIKDLVMNDTADQRFSITDRVLNAGTRGEVVRDLNPRGYVTVQFEGTRASSRVSLLSMHNLNTSFRFSIDSDLVQPVDNIGSFQGRYGYVAIYAHSFLGGEAKAGQRFHVSSTRPDGDDDVQVAFETSSGKRETGYTKWYMLFPSNLVPETWFAALPKPPASLGTPLGGVPFGESKRFNGADRLVVVATTGITLEGSEKVRAKAGQIGYVSQIDNVSPTGRQSRVHHFDISHGNDDFWTYDLRKSDWIFLTNRDGSPMTQRQFINYAVHEAGKVNIQVAIAEYNWPEVGTDAVVNGDIFKTSRGAVTGELDYNFRDGDDVYIIALDKSLNPSQNSGALAFKIAHNEDGTGPTAWVRQADILWDTDDDDEE